MKLALDERFWIEEEADGLFSVGLTPEFMERTGVMWNFVPKTNEMVQHKPFANFESSKCLTALRAPMTGTIVEWNSSFIDEPNNINPNVYLFKVRQ